MERLSIRSRIAKLPYSVTVELTTRCNERCIHCYIADHNRSELTTEEVFELLRDLKRAGTFFVTLTGGEVLVRADIMQIIEEARRLRMSVTIFTNASLLTEAMAKDLVSLGVHEVGVSLYSMDPSVHDKITTISDSWSRTISGIGYLRNAGMPVILKCPIMKANFSSFEQVLAFADEIGAETQMSPAITVMDDGGLDPVAFRINEAQLDRVVSNSRVAERSENAAHFEDACSTVPCTAVFNGGAVDSQGFVYPCNQYLLPVGNIKDSPFSEIWRSSSALEMLRRQRVSDLIECKDCDLFAYCTRCPGSAYLEDGNLAGCSKVAKELAVSRKRCSVFPAASTIFVPE